MGLRLSPLFVCFLLLACNTAKRDDVWTNYNWLPPGAEGSYNPYEIPRGPYGYGNDGAYISPDGYR